VKFVEENEDHLSMTRRDVEELRMLGRTPLSPLAACHEVYYRPAQ
jgi:hypothetical protein